MQLDAALALPGPHVRQRAAELGVPEQRREVVERDHHPDVVDRAVGDRRIARSASERPRNSQTSPVAASATASAKDRRAPTTRNLRIDARPLEAVGLAGLAGVTATGVVVARQRRAHADYDPDELRARLHRGSPTRPEPSERVGNGGPPPAPIS